MSQSTTNKKFGARSESNNTYLTLTPQRWKVNVFLIIRGITQTAGYLTLEIKSSQIDQSKLKKRQNNADNVTGFLVTILQPV